MVAPPVVVASVTETEPVKLPPFGLIVGVATTAGGAPGGKSRFWGMICWAWLGLDQRSFATAPPPPSKYSILMSYCWPPTSAMVPLLKVVPCQVQLLTSWTPLTHRRTPSSDEVVNVYVSLYCGCTLPVQRTEKRSTPIEGSGEPSPQLKSTVASTRVNL